ncbi:hypothetical protein [Pseudomonas fluorescens]|uniref:hypothetical protein n=1 Tax=Pseudomonas fluorescens TaxID=294 RepID=UPI003D0789AB
MSMTDNTSGLGKAKPGKTDDASSSSGNTESSVINAIDYVKDWGQNGPLGVTYKVTLRTMAEGANVLLTTRGTHRTLGKIQPGVSTPFSGTERFDEKQTARVMFEVITGDNSDRRPFDVVSAEFTP